MLRLENQEKAKSKFELFTRFRLFFNKSAFLHDEESYSAFLSIQNSVLCELLAPGLTNEIFNAVSYTHLTLPTKA